MITPRRLSRMAGAKLSMAEALQWLCRAEPTSKDLLEALQTWTAKTPARVALTQVTHMLITNTFYLIQSVLVTTIAGCKTSVC